LLLAYFDWHLRQLTRRPAYSNSVEHIQIEARESQEFVKCSRAMQRRDTCARVCLCVCVCVCVLVCMYSHHMHLDPLHGFHRLEHTYTPPPHTQTHTHTHTHKHTHTT